VSSTIAVPGDVYPVVEAGRSVDGCREGWEEATGWRVTRNDPCTRACWVRTGQCHCRERTWLSGGTDGWQDHVFCVLDPDGERHLFAQPYWLGPESAEDLTTWCRRNGLTWSIGDPPTFWFPMWTIPILISKERDG
jgi:hypothetical protein